MVELYRDLVLGIYLIRECTLGERGYFFSWLSLKLNQIEWYFSLRGCYFDHFQWF